MFHRVTHIVAVAALGVFLMGTQCPSIPKIETRLIDLSLYATVIQQFDSLGEINEHHDDGTLDLNEEVDFAQVLDDADLDIEDVKQARLGGISVIRCLPFNDVPDREITGATITIQRGSGPVVTVVSGFSMVVNEVTDWETVVPDDEATADLINEMLEDIIVALRNGTVPPDMVVTWSVDGFSEPGDVETDFSWKVKLDIVLVGEFPADVWG